MRINSGIAARTRNARRMGAALALAVGALGASAATAAAAPSISVTPDSTLNRNGQIVTVRGADFNAPTVTTGVYVAQTAIVGGEVIVDRTAVAWVRSITDGAFETPLTVDDSVTDGTTTVDCIADRCGISVWRQHTTPADPSELFASADISFGAQTAIRVSPAVGLARDGTTELTIDGTGFDPVYNANGFYLAYGLNTASYWTQPQTDFGAVKWVTPSAAPGNPAMAKLNADGSFSATLTIPASYTTRAATPMTIDCRFQACGILTFAAHGGNPYRGFDTATPLSFASVEVSPTTNLNRDAATTITVRGSDFSTGAYVAQSAVVGGTVVYDRDNASWVGRGFGITDPLSDTGSFETHVTVNPTFTFNGQTIDCRVTQCAVSTWRQHSAPTAAALYTTTPIAFAPAPAPDPRDVPRTEPKGPQASVTKVKPQLLGSKLGARIGFLTCKADCAVKAPKSVKVKIGKKKYTATVVVPKNGKAGKRFQVRVKLTKAAAKALAGRSAKVSVKVTLSANGKKETKTVSATVKAKKAKKAVKKQASAKR